VSNRRRPASLFGGSSAARAVALRRRRKRDRLTVMYLVWTYSEFCVQGRTSGQRVAQDHHVRGQLARPSSVTLGQNISRCLSEQCDRVSWLCLFRTPSRKCNHHHPPVMLRCFQASCRIGARLCENSGSARTRTRRFFGAAGCRARSVHLRQLGPSYSASLLVRFNAGHYAASAETAGMNS
jgi:hypothetical protein